MMYSLLDPLDAIDARMTGRLVPFRPVHPPHRHGVVWLSVRDPDAPARRRPTPERRDEEPERWDGLS